MDARLLEILVCPLCKGPLHHDHARSSLVCRADHLAYPVRNGFPVMIVDEAIEVDDAGNPLKPTGPGDAR